MIVPLHIIVLYNEIFLMLDLKSILLVMSVNSDEKEMTVHREN